MVRQVIVFVGVAAVLTIIGPPPSRSAGGDAAAEIAQDSRKRDACPSPELGRKRKGQGGSKSSAKGAISCGDRRPAAATKVPEGSKIRPQKPKPNPESTFPPNEAY